MSRTPALTAFILISTLSAAPHASEPQDVPPAVRTAQSLVHASLVAPLARKESRRSKFSRAFIPPVARRVRILDEEARKDRKGAGFVTFAIDARHGFALLDGEKLDWHLGVVTGCVYPDTQEVFVVRGDAHFPARLLLGKRVKPAPDYVCEGEPGQLAQAR